MVDSSDSTTQNHKLKLDSLISNGIQVDKNLRQPTFYSFVNYDELKVECFSIVCDLLTSQKVPLWLSQRISWYYMSEFYDQILKELTKSYTEEDSSKIQSSLFSREKIVIVLRNSISEIVKKWLEKTKSLTSSTTTENLTFSFARINSITYSEFGIKNKRRTMEDKVALYENMNLFLKSPKSQEISLFGVFDGHCGVDCSQYVSTHLPLNIARQVEFNKLSENYSTSAMQNLFEKSFKETTQRFTDKAIQESIKGK
jgi:serine/threonine protein phosphatase PrpC